MNGPADTPGVTSPGVDAPRPGGRRHRLRERLAESLPALRVIGFLVAVAIVVGIGITAARDVHPSEITWWPLPFAVLGAATWWVLLARGWALLVKGHTTIEDMSTWCRTQPLRFLPGGVWAPASRAVVLRGGLIDRISTVAAENVIAVCAALALAGVALAVSGRPWWLPLVLMLAVPAIAVRLARGRTRLEPDRTRRATVNYVLGFLAYMIAAVLAQAATSGFEHPVLVAGAAALAWAAGLVVVIAPGGLGVRELAYVGLLSSALPSGELAAGAVTMRIVMVIAELGVLMVVGRPREHGVTLRSVATPGLAFLRRHALFGTLLAAGAALRVMTWLTYKPGFVYYDSVSYLNLSNVLKPDTVRPLGYPIFLRILPTRHGLEWIPAVQHAMGIAVAVIIYALLARLGVRRWLAALAAAPVLLDAYQLVIEQYVLTEMLFELLVVAGLAALLWRRGRPGVVGAVLAGLLFAWAALTRSNGIVLMVPAVLTLLWLAGSRALERRRAAKAVADEPAAVRAAARRHRGPSSGRRRALGVAAIVALLVSFAVPVGAYATWYKHTNGSYALTGYGGRFLYARVAPFAKCAQMKLPRDERVLCPQQPPGKRLTLFGSSVEYFMWGKTPPPPITKVPPAKAGTLGGDFAKRVIRHQPLDYLGHVTHDFLRVFALRRNRDNQELPITRWRFPVSFPIFYSGTTYMLKKYDEPPRINRGLVKVLRAYQGYGYLPGPVFALGLIAGLLAALGLGRARRSGLRAASFLFAATGFVVLASTVLANQFTWRYALPELVLWPPALALGLTALWLRPREAEPDPEEGASAPTQEPLDTRTEPPERSSAAVSG